MPGQLLEHVLEHRLERVVEAVTEHAALFGFLRGGLDLFSDLAVHPLLPLL
jgi:hypothetical protein